MFSFVDAVLLKPLPFPAAERILNVWEKPPGGDRNGISTLNFLDGKNQDTVFTAMAAQTWASVTLTDSDVPVELRNGRVSAPYFDIFGAKPMLGRTFAPDEDQLGTQYEVVLSHRVAKPVWRRSQRHRPQHPAQWRSIHRDWSDAARYVR